MALRVQNDTMVKKGLYKLFYPNSIAVIGASNTEGKLGYNVFHNLISHEYEGNLYPVNPGANIVQGIKAYSDIEAIPGEIDVAIAIVPAQISPEIVRKCGEKGVKFVINEAAGFSETGIEGRIIENELKRLLDIYQNRMVGPNCSGIINTNNNMVQSIGVVGPLRKGNIGLIAQAGVYAAGILWGMREIMDFGVVATVGNKLDINETDILEFLGDDPNIAVLCMYLEDIRAGRRFVDVARRVAQNKPIIALKGGRTDTGRKAAASHTASIAGNAAIYDAVFKQSGILPAEDNEDMFNMARAFSKQPLPHGDGVLIISYAGSMGVTGTDACYENGLRLAELSEDALNGLRAIIPLYVTAKNPADLTFDQSPDQVADIVEICAGDVDVSSFVIAAQAEILEQYVQRFRTVDCGGKPLVFSVPCREFVMEQVIAMEQLGYPVYETPETAIKMLSRMYGYYQQNT